MGVGFPLFYPGISRPASSPRLAEVLDAMMFLWFKWLKKLAFSDEKPFTMGAIEIAKFTLLVGFAGGIIVIP
jgi:hypothetical protein